MAIVHDLHTIVVNPDVYAGSESLKVEVPLIFSGTVGFPRPRDGRYTAGARSLERQCQLKSKYPSFFSARWVSRYVGRGVNLVYIYDRSAVIN